MYTMLYISADGFFFKRCPRQILLKIWRTEDMKSLEGVKRQMVATGYIREH